MNYSEFLQSKSPAALEAVDIKHRILNIGTYNIEVSSCGMCVSVEIETFGKHCLGFGSPSMRAGDIEKTLAVVYECPVCFERQWSHSTVTGVIIHILDIGGGGDNEKPF